MLRDTVKKHYFGMNKEFRHRGEEPGRLENFSDASLCTGHHLAPHFHHTTY